VTDEEKKFEVQLSRYANQYLGQEGSTLNFANLDLKMRLYSSYASYLSTKRIARLTRILAYSTLALAIITAASVLVSLILRY
jgi:hypothetical protein